MTLFLPALAALMMTAPATHAEPLLMSTAQDGQDRLEWVQDDGPGRGEEVREAIKEETVGIGKQLLRVGITGGTTCACLSSCFGGFNLAGFGVLFVIVGLLQGYLPLAILGGGCIGVGLLLMAVAGLVLTPFAVVMRSLGMWDEHTEWLTIQVFRIFTAVI